MWGFTISPLPKQDCRTCWWPVCLTGWLPKSGRTTHWAPWTDKATSSALQMVRAAGWVLSLGDTASMAERELCSYLGSLVRLPGRAGMDWGLYSAVSGASNLVSCLERAIKWAPWLAQLLVGNINQAKLPTEHPGHQGHKHSSADGQGHWLGFPLGHSCDVECSLPRSET